MLHKGEILDHYNRCCVYCGRKLILEEAVLDHVIPVALQGRSTMRNLVSSCQRCNERKHDKAPPIPVQLPLDFKGYKIFPKVSRAQVL